MDVQQGALSQVMIPDDQNSQPQPVAAQPLMAPGRPISGLEQMQQLLQMQQQAATQQKDSIGRIRNLQTQRDNIDTSAVSEAYDRAYPGAQPNLLSSFAAGVRGASAFPGSKPLVGNILGTMTGLDYQNRVGEEQNRARALMQAKLSEDAANRNSKNINTDLNTEVDILKASKLAGGAGARLGSMDHTAWTGSNFANVFKKNLDLLAKSRSELPAAEMNDLALKLTNYQKGVAEGTIDPSTAPPVDLPEGVTLTAPNPATQAGQVKAAGENEDVYFKNLQANYKAPASAADKILADIDTVEKLAPVTGTGANVEKFLGNVMASFGASNSFTKNAANMTEAAKIYARSVNDRVRQEVGVQTDSDIRRFQAEVSSMTDPKEIFDFTNNYVKEIALKAQAKASFGDAFNVNHTDPESKEAQTKFHASKLDSYWRTANDTYGPLVNKIGGRIVTRSQYIQAFTNKYGPDAGAEAEQMWVKKSKEGWR